MSENSEKLHARSAASFRFYGSLNDFLSADRRERSFLYSFAPHSAIKDLIEAIGVPHPEVDLIIANLNSADFSYYPQAGDEIEVYPVNYNINATSLVRPPPIKEAR